MPSITYINDENTIRELFSDRRLVGKSTKLQSIVNEFVESNAPVAIVDWEALGYPNIACCVSVFNVSIKRFNRNNVICRRRNGVVYLIRKDRINDIFNKKEEEK